MTIFDAVKKGFAETGRLMNVVLVFFVFNVVVGMISLPLASPERMGDPGVVAISVISSIIFFLIFVFLQGGALGLVKDQLKSASASMAQFTGYGKKFYLRILGLLAMYILLAVAVVLVLSLISAALLLMGDNMVTRSLVAMLVTVVAVVVITLLLFPIYSIVAEDLGPFAALKRGMGVAKSNFLKTLGLFAVMLIVSLIISLVVGFVVGLVSMPLPLGLSQILVALVNAAVQSYIPIVMMVSFMACYMSLTIGASSENAAQQEIPSSGTIE